MSELTDLNNRLASAATEKDMHSVLDEIFDSSTIGVPNAFELVYQTPLPEPQENWKHAYLAERKLG
ncbi:hypothetical protein [Kordiimonas sp. SCSIO 12610]|uniref:hypothetical protein n=1 Tax=Kordiimonas sp. SCSIO 12610 TaxID=2829597 RepID=UPI002109B4A6|nr:hypothetical protein [Kordiimonas sp. SCSIO 12610]UTW56545.1 hypothetical protein KFF44_06500 [Kordiimonas sp. SCSIO 12610]